MEIIQALILGLVQGITEFLPISSSAHLILVPLLTGWPDQGVAFDLAVHLGTLTAVILYFRRDVFALTRDGLVSLGRRELVGEGRLALHLLIATLPAALVGLFLLDVIETSLRSVGVIVATTLFFGVLLGWADWRSSRKKAMHQLRLGGVLLIGLAQAISLIPGTSRSGATITAGLFLGLTREAASRFSFLMAIPITGLAAAAKLLEVALEGAAVDWGAFLIGGLVSFATALTAIHYFLRWLNRFGLWPYVIYRLVLGFLLYALFLA